MLPNSFIEYAATRSNISLRVGCMCNPGGAAAILGVADDMTQLYEGVTLKAFERLVGRELGVVRISLGLASNFSDVWHVVRFAEDVLSCRKARREVWDQWVRDSRAKQSKSGASGEVGRAL
jgi:molybdenum cofactor sulfurtransferase